MYYITVGDTTWGPPYITAKDEFNQPVDVYLTDDYNVYVVGVYSIIYHATDSKNLTTYLTIYLHVVEEVSDVPPADYPEMDETALSDIKSRWQTNRDSLIPTYTDPFDPEIYYSTLDGLSGEVFFIELRHIISNNITPASYDEVRFILEESDSVSSPWGTYIYGIYSGQKLIRYWDSGATWSREHVWPNSRLGVSRVSGSDRNIASDPHNLRAINTSVNSSRGNRYFTNGTSSTYQLVGTDAYYPGDDHRGDVARILFYMYVRYYDILDLVETAEEIISGPTYSPLGAKFGILSVLIDWHRLDPVSEFEINRNNVIYSYQGNRNPFIDNPEYVNIIFDIESTTTNEVYTVVITIPKVEINLNDLKQRENYFF